jgi:hypothetical protein
MRFVVARYSTRRTCASSPVCVCVCVCGGSESLALDVVVVVVVVDDGGGDTTERVRWTRGESSGSTWRALRAVEARRGVGKGMCSWLLLMATR